VRFPHRASVHPTRGALSVFFPLVFLSQKTSEQFV
jgi:hypothetical protein